MHINTNSDTLERSLTLVTTYLYLLVILGKILNVLVTTFALSFEKNSNLFGDTSFLISFARDLKYSTLELCVVLENCCLCSSVQKCLLSNSWGYMNLLTVRMKIVTSCLHFHASYLSQGSQTLPEKTNKQTKKKRFFKLTDDSGLLGDRL